MKLINASGLEFTDISSEEYREYVFANHRVRLNSPVALNVSPSGGHRVLTEDGLSHYVPSGWIHLEWRAAKGKPHFVK